MPTLVIRNIEAELHSWLKASAHSHSRSMEEEVRALLRQNFLAPEQIKAQPFGQAMRALFAPLHSVDRFDEADGLELHIPNRTPDSTHRIPDFSGPEWE
jgi:plasmid stability protein